MNDDLKINFDKIGKACRQVGDEWKKMMEENNPFDTISKIAKDIADRRDREIALEFTRCICELLKKNGVIPMIDEYRHENVKENSIECRYGVTITGLDFTEHDKRFKDEITQLKHDLDKTYNQVMEVEKETQEHIAELESELEVKDNILKINSGMLENNDKLPTDPIEVAQMLINATYEHEPSTLEKAFFKCGDTRTTERYSIDDLEQIAEHLLVYCKHHR